MVSDSSTYMRMSLGLPAEVRSPTPAIERWLLAQWQLLVPSRTRFWWGSAPIALELFATSAEVRYQVAASDVTARELTPALMAGYFPQAECQEVAFAWPEEVCTMVAEVGLVAPGWVDLAPEPAVDIVTGLLNALIPSSGVQAVLLQWLVRPARLRWDDAPTPGFWVTGRLAVGGSAPSACVAQGRRVVGALGQVAGPNRVRASRFRSMADIAPMRTCRWPRRLLPKAEPCTPRQLAYLYHPPPEPGRVDLLRVSGSPRLAAAPFAGGVTLGEGRDYAGRPCPVGIPVQDLMRHLLVIGPSGSGKTTLLAHLARQLVEAGVGVTVLDPHGGLVDNIARTYPHERLGRGALLRIADIERPIGINPFQARDAFLAADDFVEVLRRVTGRSHWGPVLDLALRHVAIAMSETGGTLVEAVRLLEDSVYRDRVRAVVGNRATSRFLERAADSSPRLQPALTRLHRLTSANWIRNVLGQTETTVDVRAVMDDGRSLLMDLSGFGLGAAQLMGSLLLLILRQAALGRRPRSRPHVVMIDEAALFLSTTVAELLDQARKYNVGLIVAAQRLGQLEPESVRNALLANVGSTIAFRIHDRDEARALARRGAIAAFTDEALMRLPRFEAYAHLTVADDRRQPAWVRIPAPPADHQDASVVAAELLRAGRQYTRPRAEVEAELDRRELELDSADPEVLNPDDTIDPFRAHAA